MMKSIYVWLSDKAIYMWLFIVGLIGAVVILFSPDLADAPWMVKADKAIVDVVKWFGRTYETPAHGLLSDHFFSEIGIAVVVAAILGATFEIFMRRREEREHHRHIHEIEDSVLVSILGYFIPASILTEVRRVFGEQILRSNLAVTYRFEKTPAKVATLPGHATIDPEDLILVTVSVEYDLINLTKKPTEHTINHGFEPTLPVENTLNKFLLVQIKRGPDVLLEWPAGPKQDLVTIVPNSQRYLRSLEAREWGKLEPGIEDNRRGKKGVVHVIAKHQLVRRRSDQDSWTTWLPADSLVVKTEIVEPLNLEFHLERTHPCEFIKKEGVDEWALPVEAKEKNGKTLLESVGVLPYQGFTLYWFPRIG